MSAEPTYLNPETVADPLGAYSHVSRAGAFVYLAGQVGVGADGKLTGKDLASQTRQTFANLEVLLESQGGGLRNVLKFTTYLVGAENVKAFFEVRTEIFPELFPEGEYPPNTLLVIDRLVEPDFLVEIEAVAHIDAARAA